MSSKSKKKRKRLPPEILLLLPALAFAAPMESDNGFYERKAEGWFWYREIPEPEPVEQEAPPPQETAPSGGQGPAPFSVAWLKKNLPKYREKAIDEPSPENVAAYFALQRLAMDKAEKFAQTFRLLPVLYPSLDENIRRPVATYASQVADREANAERAKLLGELAGRLGIFFFFKSDCPYCHAQAPVLAILERRYGFKILPISIDGRPMPGNLYQDFRVDQGQARQLGVTMTPALFLVNPDDAKQRVRLLSQGAMSLSDLESRIVNVAYDAGWIDAESYEKTLPSRPVYLDSPPQAPEGRLPPEEILRLLGIEKAAAPAGLEGMD